MSSHCASIGNDGYGQPTYSSTARHTSGRRCRIEPVTQRTVSSAGREFVPRHRVIVDATDIQVGDKIVVNSTTYVIDSIETHYDEVGVHHQELSVT